MTSLRSTPFLILAWVLPLFASPALAEEFGRLEGRVLARDGSAHGGVSVVVRETGQSTLTDRAGRYAFHRVKVGTYTLVFVHGEETITRRNVRVTAGAVTEQDLDADWELTFVEIMTVYSASRKQERVVDAPAAVTVIGEEQIEREASHGQLPKLLEFTPGAEVTQSGLYDYNFNTRGFNSSLNRRVATLIDGRNPSLPFLGAQEWAAVSFPLDDLAAAELIRGPSAALYGANAASGVLNLTTKQPRYSQGGQLRLTAGELDTTNADFRFASSLGRDWYVKINAGVRDTGDFALSRNGAAEYSSPCTMAGQTDCLPQEAAPLDPLRDNDVSFGGLRFDKYLAGGGVLTVEGGTADIEGPVFQTGIGRVQLVDVKRPWGRVNYTMDHWNFLAYYTGRDAKKQTALASGGNIALDTENITGEVQTHWDFAGNRARIVAGGSYTHEDIDSLDPETDRQTLMFRPVDNDKWAVYSQFDWQISTKVKLVLAGRADGSDLHDTQFSPKASVVYGVTPNHTLRFTYNEAFQVANYSEFFLQTDVGLPQDLSGLDGFCMAEGVTDCGFVDGMGMPVPTRVLALGNDDLELEEVQMIEVGYSGILADRAFITLDYYRGENDRFITDLLPQLGTPLGRINPDFGPWEYRGTQGLSMTAVDNIRATGPPILSNNLDGSNILAAVSYTNFGEVDTQGVDLGLNYYFDDRWRGTFTYSWFDFDLEGSTPGLDPLLLPNTPERKFSAGLSAAGKRTDGSISLRHVDEFRWVVGPFQGDVEDYTTVDLTGNHAITDNWKIGFQIANALDEAHWESFGGDLLGRRALINVLFSWD